MNENVFKYDIDHVIIKKRVNTSSMFQMQVTSIPQMTTTCQQLWDALAAVNPTPAASNTKKGKRKSRRWLIPDQESEAENIIFSKWLQSEKKKAIIEVAKLKKKLTGTGNREIEANGFGHQWTIKQENERQ